jgi:N-acyl-L-homoserine lactone synthetase
MQATTLSFDNIHKHGDLFANMLRARHRTFIERNNWDLPQADGMEFD